MKGPEVLSRHLFRRTARAAARRHEDRLVHELGYTMARARREVAAVRNPRKHSPYRWLVTWP